MGMIKIADGKLTVSSVTPRHDSVLANRKYRRLSYYAHPVRRLLRRIAILRKDMIDAEIYPPCMPRNKSRKVLSGYYGYLCELARAAV